MNAVDGSEHYEKTSDEPTPSLLTIILDTNPSAWTLLADHLSISQALSDILIFVNAHLAFNYANKVAVIASHCSTAKWLYPTPSVQAEPVVSRGSKRRVSQSHQHGLDDGNKKPRIDGSSQATAKLKLKLKDPKSGRSELNSNKYRPFRLVEEEVIHNLSDLLANTSESEVASTTSTMLAGALTLALSYINREMLAWAETNGGGGNRANGTDPNTQPTTINASSGNQTLQSRILLVSVSPSTDLAHQYIPIMNSIFACQRLSIPIDICQIPLPFISSSSRTASDPASASSSTVFLQQASDATHGIYIPLPSSTSPPQQQRPTLPSSKSNPHNSPTWSLLQYLLHAFLPSPSTRRLLILPTRIDVDFRAACFCHRRVVDIGFVCSICLSIFCSVPEDGECLTCGTTLGLGDYGARPVVVVAAAAAGAKRKKKKTKQQRITGNETPGATPTPGGTPAPS